MPLLSVVLSGERPEQHEDVEFADSLGQARGEYVWLIEAGDRLAPGALVEVTRALRATRPDVLLVHHVRAGRAAPRARELEQVARTGTVTLTEQPGLADLAPRAWNKVFRRSALEGLSFAEGPHGELAVTWPVLLRARRIAASPVPGYIRHGRDPRAPLRLFDAYAPAFAHEGPGRELLLGVMLRHAFRIAPRKDRDEFLRRACAAFRQHRRGDEPLPAADPWPRRIALLESNDPRSLARLERSLDRRDRARRRRAAIKRARRRLDVARLERHYSRRRRRAVDPKLAVYAAYWYRGYSCNPRAIYEKARELVPDVHGVWVVDAGGEVPDGVDHVIAGTRAYYDVLARARYFINNVNFPNHLVKRDGTVHVMTHHGTPLKRMGLDLRNSAVAGNRMDFEALARRCRRWDYSISANPFSTQIWERVYPFEYETLETGYPRNDPLANATAEAVGRIREQLGIEPDQTAVLYAPTHREYLSGYVPMLDLAAVADALGPRHVVLARLHYFYEGEPQLRELHEEGRIRDVAAHPSIEELCIASDALVTDYSSIMFDYAVLDRPIVIHAPDWEVYRALRGTYFDLLAEAPGPVARDEEQLVAALGEDASAQRAAFRTRFCSLEDGRAAERVVRRVFLDQGI